MDKIVESIKAWYANTPSWVGRTFMLVVEFLFIVVTVYWGVMSIYNYGYNAGVKATEIDWDAALFLVEVPEFDMSFITVCIPVGTRIYRNQDVYVLDSTLQPWQLIPLEEHGELAVLPRDNCNIESKDYLRSLSVLK